jgi:phenylalanyl-tRNA synthetase alpha chain
LLGGVVNPRKRSVVDTDVDRLQSALLSEVAAASDLAALDDVRVSALGKKGRITGLTKSLGQLDPEARRDVGARYNQLKRTVADAIAARRAELEAADPTTACSPNGSTSRCRSGRSARGASTRSAR